MILCWPSAFFWLCIINEGRSFRSYIRDFLYVSEGKRVFVQVSNKNCIFVPDLHSLSVLFLRISGASYILAIKLYFLLYQLVQLKCLPLGFVRLFPVSLGNCTLAIFL